MRRFGRGKYDNGLASAVFTHRIAAIRLDTRKNSRMHSFDKARGEHTLTTTFNQGIRTALESAAEAKGIDCSATNPTTKGEHACFA